ncbi:MAG: flagellar export chaperone FliS [Pseudomonadota bacterium]
MRGSSEYIAHYRQTRHADSGDPHHVVALLLAGAIERVRAAEGAMRQNDVANKTRLLGSALDIVEGLRLSLDHDAGGEIAGRLEALYDYMTFRLVEANLRNDPMRLQEVASLLSDIESAWAAIPPSARETARQGRATDA